MREKRRKADSTEWALPLLLGLIIVAAVALGIIALALWPLVLPRVAPYTNATPHPNMSGTQNATPPLPRDAQRYYLLKNISCSTLSRDFLIVTEDETDGTVSGLVPKIPQESFIAQ